jgi:hypothetical protein
VADDIEGFLSGRMGSDVTDRMAGTVKGRTDQIVHTCIKDHKFLALSYLNV